MVIRCESFISIHHAHKFDQYHIIDTQIQNRPCGLMDSAHSLLAICSGFESRQVFFLFFSDYDKVALSRKTNGKPPHK